MARKKASKRAKSRTVRRASRPVKKPSKRPASAKSGRGPRPGKKPGGSAKARAVGVRAPARLKRAASKPGAKPRRRVKAKVRPAKRPAAKPPGRAAKVKPAAAVARPAAPKPPESAPAVEAVAPARPPGSRRALVYLPHPYSRQPRPETEAAAFYGYVENEDKLQRIKEYCRNNNTEIVHLLRETSSGAAYLPQRRGICTLIEMSRYKLFEDVIVDTRTDISKTGWEMGWLEGKLNGARIVAVDEDAGLHFEGGFFLTGDFLDEVHRAALRPLRHQICFDDRKITELPKGFVYPEIARAKAAEIDANPHLPASFRGATGRFYPHQYALEIEIKRCFLKCRCCFQYLQPEKLRPAKMSMRFFKRLVDFIPDDADGMVVTLTANGETLAVRDLPEMIRYLSRAKPNVYSFFATNGLLLKGDRAKAILNSGIKGVLVSLNAAGREDYKWFCGYDGFNQVVRNMENFVNMRQRLGLKWPVIRTQIFGLKRWIDKIKPFAEEWSKIVDNVAIEPVSFVRNDPELENIDELKPDSFPVIGLCSFLFNFIQVSANGAIWPCCAPAWGDPTYCALGNAHELNPFEVWRSAKYNRLRALNLMGRPIMRECLNCDRRIVDSFEDSVIRAGYYGEVLEGLEKAGAGVERT